MSVGFAPNLDPDDVISPPRTTQPWERDALDRHQATQARIDEELDDVPIQERPFDPPTAEDIVHDLCEDLTCLALVVRRT